MKRGLGITLGIIVLIGGTLFFARPESLESRLETSGAQTTTEETRPAEIIASTPTESYQAPSLEAVAMQAGEYQLAIADFEAELYGGGRIRLSDLSKDKPTIIGFWASWCHNCQRNMPELSKLYQSYRKDVNVIMVNLNESKTTVDNHLKDKGYTFLTAYDEDGAIGNNYGIRYTNTHVLLDRNGNLVEAFPGDIQESHFEQLLQI